MEHPLEIEEARFKASSARLLIHFYEQYRSLIEAAQFHSILEQMKQ